MIPTAKKAKTEDAVSLSGQDKAAAKEAAQAAKEAAKAAKLAEKQQQLQERQQPIPFTDKQTARLTSVVPKIEEQVHLLTTLLAEATTPEMSKYVPEASITKAKNLINGAETDLLAMKTLVEEKAAKKGVFAKVFADLKPIHEGMKSCKEKLVGFTGDMQADK
jgi:hypothetical protein